MWILFLIIGIILLIKFIKFRRASIKIELDSVTFLEGSLGSGKTRMLTYLTLREFKKRNRFYNIKKLLNKIFPFVKAPSIPHVYSNFPIYLGKKYGFSQVVNVEVLNWQFKIEEDSIVVLDEIGYMFPNQKEKTDNAFTFGITWLRHATNALVLCASQSLSECNISFRRKVNRCYHLHDCKKFMFCFSSVEVVPVIISEDINNIYQSNSVDYLDRKFMFKNPKHNFNSRYGRNLYYLPEDKRALVSYDFTQLLKLLKLKNGDFWNSLQYDIKI